MKKFVTVCLLLCVAQAGISQEKTIVRSIMLKPKADQGLQFEAALKAHNTKFHTGADRAFVFQIINGEKMGTYQVAFPAASWADMDNEKPNPAHQQDVMASIMPKVEVNEGWIYSRRIDSLSHGEGTWDIAKSRMTFWTIKRGKMQDFTPWLKKVIAAMDDAKDPRIFTMYSKMMAGTSPQLILVSRYKNGWKEMEPNYYPAIKDLFIKKYSAAEWEEYMKAFTDCVEKEENYLRVFRPDLSSK